MPLIEVGAKVAVRIGVRNVDLGMTELEPQYQKTKKSF